MQGQTGLGRIGNAGELTGRFELHIFKNHAPLTGGGNGFPVWLNLRRKLVRFQEFREINIDVLDIAVTASDKLGETASESFLLTIKENSVTGDIITEIKNYYQKITRTYNFKGCSFKKVPKRLLHKQIYKTAFFIFLILLPLYHRNGILKKSR